MPPSNQAESNRALQAVSSPAPRARFRVLLVEDDPAFSDFLAWSLVGRGYAVESAENLAEALMLLGEGQGPARFDLVLSDIALPGAPGTDLLFSHAVVARKTPLILMSGFATNELQAFVAACGAELLSKPFKLDSLFQCVTDALPQSAERA